MFLLIMIPARSAAQDPEGLDDEKLNRHIKSIQAGCVAEELTLDADAGKKLTASYLDLLEEISLQRKDKLEGLEGEERQQESEKITQTCLEAFSTELGTYLTPEQTDHAVFILGSLNKRWDQYLKVLAGFGLEEDAMNRGSKAVYEYIVQNLLERKKATEANTRLSGRIATAQKEELDRKISQVLTEDQFAAWSEATARKKKS
jgi:hypothetical protein